MFLGFAVSNSAKCLAMGDSRNIFQKRLRKNWNLNLMGTFSLLSPSSRKYFPETLSQEDEAYIGEKGHSSATLLTVLAVSKILPSTKETNLLRHLSCSRRDILVIIESPTKNGHKCILQKSAIKWRSAIKGATSWLVKQNLLHWAVYVQGFPPPHMLGCRLTTALPSSSWATCSTGETLNF